MSLDFDEHTISVPRSKVEQLLTFIQSIQHQSFITYKEAQSLVGRIAHVARVVRAARLFMTRILEELRNSDSKIVKITQPVKNDLNWFQVYFQRHNAKSMIPDLSVHMVIEADSSLVAGAAWTGNTYYVNSYSQKMSSLYSICQLEALNYLVAVRCFVKASMKGKTIEITGDNGGAIAAISSGRACDPTLAAVARALWYHAASRDVQLVFTHRAGELIPVADALSRAPISAKDNVRADAYIKEMGLKPVRVFPSMQNFDKYM